MDIVLGGSLVIPPRILSVFICKKWHRRACTNQGQSDPAHTALLVSVNATGKPSPFDTYRASFNVRPARKESHGQDRRLGLCSSCMLGVVANLGIVCVYTNCAAGL